MIIIFNNYLFKNFNKDIIKYMDYLHELFPIAKFIYMVRDGRAASFSLTNHVYNKNMNAYSRNAPFHHFLADWNKFNFEVNKQCEKIGISYCKVVKYEDLVINNKETIKDVIEFLNLDSHEDLMLNMSFLNSKAIPIAKIYTHSLKNWIGNVKLDENSIVQNFSMLQKLGY